MCAVGRPAQAVLHSREEQLPAQLGYKTYDLRPPTSHLTVPSYCPTVTSSVLLLLLLLSVLVCSCILPSPFHRTLADGTFVCVSQRAVGQALASRRSTTALLHPRARPTRRSSSRTLSRPRTKSCRPTTCHLVSATSNVHSMCSHHADCRARPPVLRSVRVRQKSNFVHERSAVSAPPLQELTRFVALVPVPHRLRAVSGLHVSGH